MKNLSRFASPLMFILLLSSPVYAQAASDQDIAALKEQIAKLSQKVDELQSKNTAATSAATVKRAKKPKAVTPAAQAAAAAPAVVAASVVPAPNQETAVVSAPVAPATSSDYVTKGSFPGSFKIPGTETSVKIGGYIKLDAIEDIGSGYGANYAKFYAIPLNNSPQAQQSAQTTLGAQQSRINLETRTATSLGEVKTFVEGDFYGSNAANANTSGYGFEVRHAYGTLGSSASETGQILAGQTWSNFMDTAAMPETMDYIGPAGTIFVRQAQLRYAHDLGPVTLSGSIEAPLGNQSTATQTAVTYSNGSTTDSAHGKLPDAVIRADYKYTDDGYVSLRGLGSQMNIDRSVGATNNTASEYGYGIALSGKQGFLAKDAVIYDFVYGKGTGRYVYDVGASGNYYNTTNNFFDEQRYYAGTVGVQHIWSDQFRSNLFGGAIRNINDTQYSGLTANKYVASGHVNLIWQPVPAYKVGLEYMHGYRKIENGEEGQLNRMEGSFIFGF
jgi:hypothetical protein